MPPIYCRRNYKQYKEENNTCGWNKYVVSPTNVSEENEIVTFYDELSSLVRSIPKHNMLVIGGDMNAQIGKNGNNKYSLHNTSNRNGQHLTDFMIENRLACLNTNNNTAG